MTINAYIMLSFRNPSKIQQLVVVGRNFQREFVVASLVSSPSSLSLSSSVVETGKNPVNKNNSCRCSCPTVSKSYSSMYRIVDKSIPNSTISIFKSSEFQSFQQSREFSTCTSLWKKSKSTTKSIDEEEDEIQLDDEEMEILGKGDKILKVRLLSDRLDAILKAAFQMSRNKIEKAFYADRIRVNGERPKKKSLVIGEGDEVDIIRKYNSKNPEYLDVSRAEILEMGTYSRTEDEDSDDDAKIPAKIRRSKNLTIENYKTPFKGNLDDNY